MTRDNDTVIDHPTFINNFWGENDLGYSAVQERIQHSLSTIQELLDYYLERTNIEKEYSKRLERLSQIRLGSRETGSLKVSLDKLNYENDQMIQQNHKFIKSVNQINYSKLNNFNQIYTKKVKKIMAHMNKLISKKNDIMKDLHYTKENYQSSVSQIKSLNLLVQTTWGKELEKNEKKLMKLEMSLKDNQKNYRIAVDNCKKINEIYQRDWLSNLKEIYQLEIERIQVCKINCFNYCNNIATLCVDHDQSADQARSYFAKVSPPQDLQDFSNNYGTGNKIYESPDYVDFMEGFEETPKQHYTIANYDIPEYNHILSRSYSTYSEASHSQKSQPTSPVRSNTKGTAYSSSTDFSTHSYAPSSNNFVTHTSPTTGSPKKLPTIQEPLQRLNLPKPEDTKSASSSTGAEEKADVFSMKSHTFNASNSSSNYSNPTNYSSTSERNWASPRRKEKQLSQFQERINLKSKELPHIEQTPTSNGSPQKIPIMKDFSIDFIAKALEDLNQGGDGDVDQYRRSVRLAKQHEESRRSKTAPSSPYKHDDDHNEVPTRYESINFKSAPRMTQETPTRQTARPRSMYDTFSSPQKRLLLRTPARSYTNLHSMIEKITPINKKTYVTKARARYSYRAQHHGELNFKKGSFMYVIYKQPDNWFLCELGDNCGERAGELGLVPGNYITEGDGIF